MPPMETVKIFDNSGKVIANVSAVTPSSSLSLGSSAPRPQHECFHEVASCLVDAPH